jgi:hypothetical protein
MSEKHGAAGHHRSAAMHHTQAAHHHSEAFRHYETGKDYAHAAHQALLAHGHGLRALNYADEARVYYAAHDLDELPMPSQPTQRVVAGSLEVVGAPASVLSSAAHHAAAATHHEKAAHHHQEAARLYDDNEHARAAHEAQMAHRHAHYAIFHDDEAAMHHVEHYGKSGQSAEIS